VAVLERGNRIAAGASPLARAATTYLMEPGSLINETQDAARHQTAR
jgi:hypothetical protein